MRKLRQVVVCGIFLLLGVLPASPSFLTNDILFNDPSLTQSVSGIRFHSRGQRMYALWEGQTSSSRKLFFQRSSDQGITWLSQEKVIAEIPGQDTFAKVEISADENRVYVWWVRNNSTNGNKTVYVAVSVNQGETWQISNIVSTSSFTGADVAHDDEGGLCAVWAAQEVYSRCSNNGGQTWTSATIVNMTGFPISPNDIQREPAVAAGGNGKFYVTWTDNRGATGNERYVYVTRSLNGGLSWETDRMVVNFPSNGPLCIEPDIVADKNGRVVVSWINKIWWGQGETYRYSVSTAYSGNSGASWQGGAGSSSYAIAPKLLLDETTGRFFIFWLNDNNHAYRKLQARFSDDGGATWSPTVVVGPNHDVQQTHYDAAVSNNVLAAIWENLKPWPGIYVNYSFDGGETWLQREVRADHTPSDEVVTAKPGIGVAPDGTMVVAWDDNRDARANIYRNKDKVSLDDLVRREADFILSCQYLGTGGAYGAINDVPGDPTWIVPRENAMAILGLLRASDFLKNDQYRQRAQLAADYLIRIQQDDGAWANEYWYDIVSDPERSPTQTAEVMMAFYHLGYRQERYLAMKRGAEFLLLLQDPENKGGFDDGLIGGGRQGEQGEFHRWRWASDNAYAYQAFKAAYAWAVIANETDFAEICLTASNRIVEGINTYLHNSPVWHTAIDEWGNPQGNPDLPQGYKHLPNWISYAPQMLDLPAIGVNSPGVGDWIASSFQQQDGALIVYSWDQNLKTRKYPGYSFQAALAWLDTGHLVAAKKAISWTMSSGLWNEDEGGWVDWIEVSPDNGLQAPEWQRFIDTSFYSIAALTGGYDFNSHYVLHIDVPHFMQDDQYYSGAAAAQMILSVMNDGAADLPLQHQIVTHMRGTSQITSDFSPDEMDLVLGHFDPYDVLVSDHYDQYDTLPDGNPYQGYNFSVGAHDPVVDPDALKKYMRDIAHWMAYPVTKRAWFLTPRELVKNPNTPSAVPLFGSYNHWVVIRGFKASIIPAPDPHQNPHFTRAFTVYGFWINDPAVDGIGADTFKTAEECALNYFFPVVSNDVYNGKLVHVSEPPPILSEEDIYIAEALSKPENLEVVLNIKEKDAGSSVKAASSLMVVSAMSVQKPVLPSTWRDIVDPVMLQNRDVVEAFDGKERGEALLVKHLDDTRLDYYIVPYGTWKGKKDFMVNAAILLDAHEGFFKEASWQKVPAELLKVSSDQAKKIALRLILREYEKAFKDLMKGRLPLARLHNEQVKIFREYNLKMLEISRAVPDLVWGPSVKTPNPYQPMWRLRSRYGDVFVTQDGDIF